MLKQKHQQFLLSAWSTDTDTDTVSAVGCPDQQLPADTWHSQEDATVTVGCVGSSASWTLVCELESGSWLGSMGHCDTLDQDLETTSTPSQDLETKSPSKASHSINKTVKDFTC